MSVPGKLMEIILKDKIVKHIEQALLGENQHGFCKVKFCLTNHLEFFERVNKCVDKMGCSWSMFCLSLFLCGILGECFGITLVPKDKRGWTLNSAGYLLGPPMIPLPKADAHQTLPDKGGLAGKRAAMEDLISLGQDSFDAVHPSDDSTLQTLMDFLSYLRLRDQGAVPRLPLTMSEESMQQ
ncbi:galanin peptides-like isoform X2 [Hemicordylus capensis]|uniref:galanin peptides-like isoform X2 n=1 Tax=Hemicordylus capensis TaxID=884348 RepID=UPI0023034D06|nr:galanin peptides-like isoform X2 [Hemicordylus capensis]